MESEEFMTVISQEPTTRLCRKLLVSYAHLNVHINIPLPPALTFYICGLEVEFSPYILSLPLCYIFLT